MLEISIRKYITPNNEWIRITDRYRIGPEPSYTNEDNEKIKATGKKVQALFAIRVHIYKIGDIPIGGVCSVRLFLRNVWTS